MTAQTKCAPFFMFIELCHLRHTHAATVRLHVCFDYTYNFNAQTTIGQHVLTIHFRYHSTSGMVTIH